MSLQVGGYLRILIFENMIQILRGWCRYLFHLVTQKVKRCLSNFLPASFENGTHRVQQLFNCCRSASDNLINHQLHTRSRPCRRSDHIFSYRSKSTDEPSFCYQPVVENPFQACFADSLRRRDKVIERLLGNDHILNEFMACGSEVPIGSSSSEFADAEESLNHIEPNHVPSEENSDSSLNYENLSCEIKKFLQSVITTIENKQKPSEFSEISAEPRVMLTDIKTVPKSDWLVESFPIITESREQIFEKISNEPTLRNVAESFLMGAESIESTAENAAAPFPIVSESSVSALHSATECLDVTESSERTLQHVSESTRTESSEAIPDNVTISITESNEPTLLSLADSLTEVSECNEQSLDNTSEVLTISGSTESMSEKSCGPDILEISPQPQSSSVITFKEINNKYLYMPQLVAADFGMKESARNWDVNWTHDFVSFRTCRKMKMYQRINHFPGSICLSNKDLLGKNLNVMYECFPNDYDIFPRTWFIPGDIAKVERYARKNRGASFIVKPHDGGAGSGIKITSSLRELNSHSKIVCQLYIQRPFLIDGYKFDFRVYVLMTSIEPLRIFVHKEGLARFATVKYEKPSAGNSSKKCMHLTNTCVNKNSPSYIRDESKGSTRRITNVFQWFVDNSIDAGKVQDSMDDTIIKTIIVCLPTLKHYYHMSFPYHTSSISCFELMGFDIMLDHKLKVYLLEVNVAPSFANETGTSHVACIKQEVVSDTFRILNLMETERNHMIEGRNVFSKVRIKGLQKDEKRTKRIYADQVKDKVITNKRIEWENSHMGNFRKIFPPGAIQRSYYQKFVDKAMSRLRPNHYLNSRETELTGEQRKWLT